MKTLVFLVTEKCTAKCRFCGPRCSPEADPTYLESVFMNQVLDRAYELYDLGLVAFIGGEPLLKPENLKSVIMNAKARGINTRIVTNGFWGKTIKSAETMSANLAKWGLDEVNISVDDYHQEFVPIESVINCVNALRKSSIKIILAHKVGLNTKHDVQFYERKLGEKIVLIDSRSELRHNMIGFCSTYTQPIGWSAETENPNNWLKKFGSQSKFKGCDQVMSMIAINSQGKLSACCGLASRHIPALLGENVNKVGLKKAIDAANVSTLWNLLAQIGPEGIIQFIKNKNPQHKFLDGYVGKCHACESLFSDEINLKILAENLDELREMAICKRIVQESNRNIILNMTCDEKQ